ncbi:hypothetical protein KUL156_57520 [Alteromonas sp. KUL156]|nr:hypothetical protein KUL154_51000 [Alteromonas sp. KUL154]GFE03160.1 hypothetical protein KUL156_57520 [Alteromonas sp. KUL156]
MILKSDSILRKIPSEIGKKQLLIIDGIRLTVDAIDINFQNLKSHLLNCYKTGTKQLSSEEVTKLLIISTSIIDFTDKFSKLLSQLDYYRGRNNNKRKEKLKKITDIKEIVDISRCQEIILLRNTIQHINGNIDKIVSKKDTIFGTLRWVHILQKEDSDEHQAISGIITFGKTENYYADFINPYSVSEGVMIGIDEIEYSLGDKKMSITWLIVLIKEVCKILEKEIKSYELNTTSTAKGDRLMMIDWKKIKNTI